MSNARDWMMGVGLTILVATFTLMYKWDDVTRMITIKGNTYSYFRRNLSDEITIVTAFFKLPPFAKGGLHHIRGPEVYQGWLKKFKGLQNPVYGFFDDQESLDIFVEARKKQPLELTRVRLVNRSSMWAFSLLDDISKLYSTKGYPHIHPNTVVPEYPCIMNAKYELVQLAAILNEFHTKYIAWLDIGYLRHFEDNNNFTFYVPDEFDESQIAYTEVRERNRSFSINTIVRRKKTWLGGGYFFGEVQRMIKWTEEYMKAAERMLYDHKLMSTDQQVLYAMYNWMNLTTQIQVFLPRDGFNKWFSLGYICREAGWNRTNTNLLNRH